MNLVYHSESKYYAMYNGKNTRQNRTSGYKDPMELVNLFERNQTLIYSLTNVFDRPASTESWKHIAPMEFFEGST